MTSYQSDSFPFVLKLALWQATIFEIVDLRVAQRAVLQLKVLQLLVQGLMLADLARVVLLLKDAHATGNAWRVMSSTLLASDVKLVDEVATLRTVELLLFLRIVRGESREQVDSQKLIGLPLLLGDRIKSLKLVQRLATLLEAPVEVRGDGDEAVNILRLQLFLVFDQTHRCFHCSIVVFLIELPLAEEVEVDRLGPLPRVSEGLVCRGTDV